MDRNLKEGPEGIGDLKEVLIELQEINQIINLKNLNLKIVS